MSEIEKRLRENRKSRKIKMIAEGSLFKVGDRVQLASEAGEYLDLGEILGLEDEGLYRVRVDGSDDEHIIEEIYLHPIQSYEDDDEPDDYEQEDRGLLRPVLKPISTATRPNIYEGDSYKIFYTRDPIEVIGMVGRDTDYEEDQTGSVLVYDVDNEDEAIQKAIDKVNNDSNLVHLNPRNFRIAHRLGDRDPRGDDDLIGTEEDESFDDFVVESRKNKLKKSLKEYDLVGGLASDEIDNRYIDLRSDLKGRSWSTVIDLVNEIEDRGFLVSSYNNEFILVVDLEDTRSSPAEHLIPIKDSIHGGIVVRD